MNFSMSKNWVDTHFHVFHEGQAVHAARYVPQYSARLSDWMRQAQSVGITRGVWVQPSFLGTDNRLMLQALEAHPEKLRGVAVVSSDAQTQELEALHAVGVRGIRLNLAGISHEIPQWTRATRVWEAMQKLGWHLEVHTDQGKLPEVLAQLPSDVSLIVDHMAKPLEATAQDPSIAALVKHAQNAMTHVKLSGAYRLAGVDALAAARVLFNELGPSALLWGSDWPCTNHEQFAHFDRLVKQACEWIGAEHLDQVMRQNPMAVYWRNR